MKRYQKAISEWLAHDGLSGGGGAWNRKERKYDWGAEPVPEQSAGDAAFEIKLFAQIKAQEVALHNRKHAQ